MAIEKRIVDEWERLYLEEDLSAPRIGEIHNTSNAVVIYHLKQRGIKIARKNYKSKYTIDRYYFKELDQYKKFYWLGYMYADTYHFRNEKEGHYGLRLKLQKDDIYLIEEFKKDLATDRPIKWEKNCKTGVKYPYLQICNKEIYQDLFNYGLIPQKTHRIKVPEHIFKNDEQVRHFILGLFDGDGNTSEDAPGFEINGNKDLLEWVKAYLNRRLNVEGYDDLSIEDKNCYRIGYGGALQVIKIRDWLYKDNPFCLKRKKDILFSIEEDFRGYEKKYILSCCPTCKGLFHWEKQDLFRLKKKKFKAKFCGLSCSSTFYRQYQLNDYKLTNEMEYALKENLLCFFRQYTRDPADKVIYIKDENSNDIRISLK